MTSEHEIDQSIAAMRNLFPRAWRQMYLGAVDAGFTEAQAMDLVKTYILSQNPYGIHPPDSGGANNENKEDF